MTDLLVMILLVGLGSHAKVGAQAGPAGGKGSSEQALARRMHPRLDRHFGVVRLFGAGSYGVVRTSGPVILNHIVFCMRDRCGLSGRRLWVAVGVGVLVAVGVGVVVGVLVAVGVGVAVAVGDGPAVAVGDDVAVAVGADVLRVWGGALAVGGVNTGSTTVLLWPDRLLVAGLGSTPMGRAPSAIWVGELARTGWWVAPGGLTELACVMDC
jgi:hypothetical protein